MAKVHPSSPIWLIGCGNMGSAMLERWIASGLVAPTDVFVANRADRVFPAGVRQGRTLPDEAAPDEADGGGSPLADVALVLAIGVAIAVAIGGALVVSRRAAARDGGP